MEPSAERLLNELPRLIAHRGGGHLAPENTLAGIRAAARLGYRGVEFDVRLARCGTPVLMHDCTLLRTTGVEDRVRARTAVEIAALAACDRQIEGAPPEYIPTLAQAAALCLALGLFANVEIKADPGDEAEAGAAIGRAVAALWVGRTSRVLLSSFSEIALSSAATCAPGIERGWLTHSVPPDWRTRMAALAAVSLHCSADAARCGALQDVVLRAVPVLVYTVNSPAEVAHLLGRGVASVFTDALDDCAPQLDT